MHTMKKILKSQKRFLFIRLRTAYSENVYNLALKKCSDQETFKTEQNWFEQYLIVFNVITT